MSNDIAISVHDLGKRYRLVAPGQSADSVRDLLSSSLNRLFTPGARPKHKQFWALQHANFDIRKGENVGIIGLNGAGKSTLLKIHSRIVTPTAGTASITGRLGALLEVGTGFHQELTGRENLFLYGAILGMTRAEVAAKYDAIVDFSEIGEFIDMPVKRYSSGMYVRLAFAVAAHLDPDILLLDEVLAVGDFTFQRKCLGFARQLQRKGSTILFVSHNMFSIKSMCQRVIYLKRGQVVFDGPTDEALAMYEKDSRLADAPWYDGHGDVAPITMTDISLRRANGKESTVFDYGEPMTVHLRYKTTRPVSAPDIRVGFTRCDEVHCNTFSTAADGLSIPVLDGEGEIELVTPPLKLVSELYRVNLVVRENTLGEIVCAQLGGSFHIRHEVFGADAYGIFHEDAEWRHTAQAKQRDKAAHGVP